MTKETMNKSTVRRAVLHGASAVAIAGALVAGYSAPAIAQTAYSDVNFATSGNATIVISSGAGLPLGTDFTTISGVLPGYAWPSFSVQTLYNNTATTLGVSAITNNVGGPSGILAQLTGFGSDPANISLNTIYTGAFGNVAAPAPGATFDLGLLSTGNTAGSLITQYLGREGSGNAGVSATANADGQFVGVDYTNQQAADLVVDANTIVAQTALNTATTLMAGAVPVSYANTASGGSSTITLSGGDVALSSAGGIGLNTTQVTQDGGIASGTSGFSGSFAIVTGSRIAVETQATSGGAPGNLSSPITLNGNDIGAQFVGNASTSVFQSASSATDPTNAFTGTVAISNAQVNRETSANALGVNAEVSNSSIIADLTYNGISSFGFDGFATPLTSSLSLSGTATNPQSVSASAVGNQAGSITSTGQVTTAGNVISFTNSSVNLAGDTNSSGGAASSGGTSTAYADLAINNLQANLSGAGVEALVSGSGVQAAADDMSAAGSVTANYNEVSSQVAGNAAGNLIDAAANNVDARMAVMGTQQNSGSSIEALTTNSGVTVGIGNFLGNSANITVSDLV